jgi:hypothetical protein
MTLAALGCQGGGNSGSDSGGGADLASSTDLISKADSDGSTVNDGCPSFSPCGGTILPGTYAITAFCGSADPVAYTLVCQAATLTTTSVEASGTYVFSADGTYSNSVTVTPHGILAVPASCMTQPESTVQTCTDLDKALLEHIGSGSTPATIICSGTTDCACTIVMTETISVGDAYSIQGDTLTLFSPSNSSQAADPYCVSGNQITVSLGSTSGFSVSHGAMVLTRQ